MTLLKIVLATTAEESICLSSRAVSNGGSERKRAAKRRKRLRDEGRSACQVSEYTTRVDLASMSEFIVSARRKMSTHCRFSFDSKRGGGFSDFRRDTEGECSRDRSSRRKLFTVGREEKGWKWIRDANLMRGCGVQEVYSVWGCKVVQKVVLLLFHETGRTYTIESMFSEYRLERLMICLIRYLIVIL